MGSLFLFGLTYGRVGIGVVGPLVTRPFWQRGAALDKPLRPPSDRRYSSIRVFRPTTAPFVIRLAVGAPASAHGFVLAASSLGYLGANIASFRRRARVRAMAAEADAAPPPIRLSMRALPKILHAHATLSRGGANNRAGALLLDNRVAAAALIRGHPRLR